jgi:hypothetical protein
MESTVIFWKIFWQTFIGMQTDQLDGVLPHGRSREFRSKSSVSVQASRDRALLPFRACRKKIKTFFYIKKNLD